MTQPTYRIKNWNELYENNRTRDLKKLDWVPIPNKQDGDGYTLIMEMKNGPAIFGAWVALVQVASRCNPRGTLLRDGGKPHDSSSLSRMTRVSEALIKEAFQVLSSPDISWLEVNGQQEDEANPAGGCENPAPKCENPAGGCLEGKGREGKEGKGKEGSATAPPLEVPLKLRTQKFLNAWERWQTFRRGMKRMKNWLELFEAQLQYLERFDVETATEMLEQSIRNGWQGIFELKQNHGSKTFNGTDRPNPRNVGTIKGTTDYGEAGRRKLERQRQEREAGAVAGQVAPDAPAPPPTEGAGR